MGKIFGAYTDISWQINGGDKNGNGNTFVFSIRDDFNFEKFKCQNKSNEVNHSESYLTAIGCCPCAFLIYDDCNINTKSYSYLGYSG